MYPLQYVPETVLAVAKYGKGEGGWQSVVPAEDVPVLEERGRDVYDSPKGADAVIEVVRFVDVAWSVCILGVR